MNARDYDREIGQFIGGPLGADTIVPDPSNLFDYNRYLYVRGNPMKYTDPTGHTVDWNCWYCNTQWLDYSGAPGWLNRTADNLAVASCFVAGCHVDTEADTIAGPTQEEAAYDMANQLIGVGLTPIGMIEAPRVPGAIANKSLSKLAQTGTGTNEVAFGLSRYLPSFKKVVPQAMNYADLGLNPYADDFGDKLLETMHGADKIHFNLSNMRGLTGPDGVLTGPKELNAIASTNWELRTIWDNLTLRTKTIFYRDGKVIPTEDLLQLK